MTASLRTLEAVISSLGLNSLVRVREAAPIFFGQKWHSLTSNPHQQRLRLHRPGGF